MAEATISLKILIDIKSKKVVFAEAGKDFVDFIFCIMSLPLSTVTKLLNEEDGMVGCLGSLYKSIESLDAKYYVPDVNKDSVLNRGTAYAVPSLPLGVAPTTTTLYRCFNHPTEISSSYGARCSRCFSNSITSGISFLRITPSLLVENKPGGFVKEAASYMVMDNLEVQPMSLSLMRSLVKDFDYMEEKEVEFGPQEGLKLLKASLETQAVLTTVFLPKKFRKYNR